MSRRVLVPVLLVLAVWVLTGALSLAASYLDKRAIQAAMGDRGMPLTLPVLPGFSWLLFLTIFFAVRLCATRGGTRRECLQAGLLPLVLLAGAPLGLAVYHAGLRALPIGLGLGWHYYFTSNLGTIVAVRDLLSTALTSAAICLVATWLYLYVSGSGRLPAPHPDGAAA